jgi:hypothetical protein
MTVFIYIQYIYIVYYISALLQSAFCPEGVFCLLVCRFSEYGMIIMLKIICRIEFMRHMEYVLCKISWRLLRVIENSFACLNVPWLVIWWLVSESGSVDMEFAADKVTLRQVVFDYFGSPLSASSTISSILHTLLHIVWWKSRPEPWKVQCNYVSDIGGDSAFILFIRRLRA